MYLFVYKLKYKLFSVVMLDTWTCFVCVCVSMGFYVTNVLNDTVTMGIILQESI